MRKKFKKKKEREVTIYFKLIISFGLPLLVVRYSSHKEERKAMIWLEGLPQD